MPDTMPSTETALVVAILCGDSAQIPSYSSKGNGGASVKALASYS